MGLDAVTLAGGRPPYVGRHKTPSEPTAELVHEDGDSGVICNGNESSQPVFVIQGTVQQHERLKVTLTKLNLKLTTICPLDD